MPKSLCDQCAGLCCRYFALPIDNPETKGDYDDIRWYLVHENVVAFVEKGQWYLGILNRCKHLLPDNRCGIYERRPRVCRGYSTDNCEYHGGDYDYEHLFLSAEQLWDYARKTLAQKRKKRRARVKRRTRRQLGRLNPLLAGGSSSSSSSSSGGSAPVPLTLRGAPLA